MGICPIFGTKSDKKSSQHYPRQAQIDSHTNRPLHKEESGNDERKINQQDNSLNNSKGETNTKPTSTGIGLSDYDKKGSILSQVNTFDSSSILVKNKFSESHMNQSEFYTLIDKVFFVKKTMDRIKVATPYNESELNCSYKSLLSTMYLSQGLPLESLKEISQGKIIQTSNSPIKITIKATCSGCRRKIKLTFSKSFISTEDIACDGCKSLKKWALDDIQSNVPLWGDGRKIENGECLENLPSPLRALGCIYCMKYVQCQELPCKCFICSSCKEQKKNTQCHICDAVE